MNQWQPEKRRLKLLYWLFTRNNIVEAVKTP